MAKQAKIDLSNPVGLRKKAGENQATYWRKFGVTQSGGSRYEQGRNIPSPTKLLMALHASGKVSDDDLAHARVVAGL
jgi:transcriptional regulator with XRE-family HTH domain